MNIPNNVKIITVPTETDNGIDQLSTVEEILACDEHIIWNIPNLCQAMNDEDFTNDTNWVFLVDMDKKMHLNTN